MQSEGMVGKSTPSCRRSACLRDEASGIDDIEMIFIFRLPL